MAGSLRRWRNRLCLFGWGIDDASCGGRIDGSGGVTLGAVGNLRGARGDDIGLGGVQGRSDVSTVGRRDIGCGLGLVDRAHGGRDGDSLSGDMRLGRAIGNLNGAMGDSSDLGGIDGRGSHLLSGVGVAASDESVGSAKSSAEDEKALHFDGVF